MTNKNETQKQKARRRLPRQRADESSFIVAARHTAAGTVWNDGDGYDAPAAVS
jgi:hypothetical protein